MSCEHAFLALLDALEIQRGILGDASRGADADSGPHRAAFETLERAAVTEANRLTADASVAAVVRARARSFVTAATRTPTRSGLRAVATPPAPVAVVPRMTTPVAQIATVAVLPRAPSGTRPNTTTTTPPSSPSPSSSSSSSSSPPAPAPATTVPSSVPPYASPASGFPGLAAVGALAPDGPPPSRMRAEDHLAALTAGWSCPHCSLDVARALHVARVLGGRSAVVVDVVCGNCGRRSPLPSAQLRAFDRLFGPFIGQSGTSFRPDAHGLQWDGT